MVMMVTTVTANDQHICFLLIVQPWFPDHTELLNCFVFNDDDGDDENDDELYF